MLFKIERSDTIQTEFMGNNREYTNYSIQWTGPCSYELSFLNEHLVKMAPTPEAYKRKKVKVTILSVQNDTCFVTADNGISSWPGIFYINKK